MITVDGSVLSNRIARHLGKNALRQQDHIRKLSSGKRINASYDDAAGLGVSMRIKASARSRYQVANNIDRSLGVLKTGEGGLTQMQDMIKRLRELAVQAADGSMSDKDRAMIQTEVRAVVSEIDRTARSTYATEAIRPLGNYLVDFVFAIDSSGSMQQEITTVKQQVDAFKQSLESRGVDVAFALLNVTSNINNKGDSADRVVKLADINSGNFSAEITALNAVGAAVDPYDPIIEATENPTLGNQNYPAGGEAVHPDKLTFRKGAERQMVYLTDTNTTEVYTGAARTAKQAEAVQALKDHNVVFNVIGDTNYKTEYDPLVNTNGGSFHDIGANGSGVAAALQAIVDKTPVAVSSAELVVQAGPNTSPEDRFDTGIPVSAIAPALGLADLEMSTQADAQAAIATIDDAQTLLNGYATRFGAAINRLQIMRNANDTMRTEEESTLSQIEDLDIARESSAFMRTQIRMQAGASLLVQSREMSSESVLRLLRA